jgi:hypothetical protein
MKKGRALYRIEKNGIIQPYGRFYSWEHAFNFLKTKFGYQFAALWPKYLIIDDNNIPF